MPKNILVIDDEKGVRDAFLLALEDTDYDVTTAASGESGIEKFTQADFDLVYLDLKMPGMSGVEVLRALRRRNAEVHIYIVTAFARAFFEGLEQVRADGVHFELLRKPVGSKEILSLTRALLG